LPPSVTLYLDLLGLSILNLKVKKSTRRKRCKIHSTHTSSGICYWSRQQNCHFGLPWKKLLAH